MHRVIVKGHRRVPALFLWTCTISLCLAGCSAEPKQGATAATVVPTAEATSKADAGLALPISRGPDAAPAMSRDAIRTISLSDETPVAVPGSELSAFISGSFHKSRAPLVGVSVLLTQGEQKAEVSWRIESGHIESAWRPLKGRRYDDESSAYVDEEIRGWVIRLDSVEDHSAGGDPTAITISLQREP